MIMTKLLQKLNATVSMSEGRRAVAMGVVKLNGFPVQDTSVDFEFNVGDVIEVGKHKKFVLTEEDIFDLEAESQKAFESFKDILKDAECDIENCHEKATGLGAGKPYCGKHFWEEFDKSHGDQ